MADALGGFFSTFLKYLYQSGDISIPSNYHDRCVEVRKMLDNDISGTINTVLDYAINSSSEAKYRVECSEATLQKLLNKWFEDINVEIAGIPTGLQALSKEYFKERWEGSSFCILRVQDWEEITVDNVTIEVPTTMWFVNGSSIYVARKNPKNFKLGSDKYYLDEAKKIEIISNEEQQIIVQKPYNRWFDEYSTPYLIRKGVLKNYLAMKMLQDKSDEVVSKILPYLFLITKGTENLYKEGVNYDDDELSQLTENFKTEVEKYKNQKGKTPTNAIPFDTKYEHLIPDLSKVLKEELYRQGYRSILAGLGFIDMLEISPSRQETRMNPKAFISEINEGVFGFKAILLEVIGLIELKNKKNHPKLFAEKGKLTIVNSPLRINVEQILDALRSGFDRGVASIETYQEILGLDPETEKERRDRELKNGDEDRFYPHLVQNIEAQPDRVTPAKPRTDKKEKIEDEDKKSGTPESKDFKNANENLEMAPYKNLDELPPFIKKMPIHAQEIFMSTFNSVYEETGDDSKAMAIAISAAKRWLKKEGYIYDKEKKIWEKK